ncbi:Hypothetical protein NCS54_00363200 [Fusarium falciforme]|uniref:Hypothetical protein n=1 Tax=Fusarium falciforme TaxID=195108 RepID=UPI0022FFDCA4|nr:Hypothetical protein NCS54_00363200 [Fusarium falciforme]WAO86360.1 Hypothetical protein NCS54_00363200 [Fusarium falciforme]
MAGCIKQIAAGRRKPNMTRKEYFDHRFRIHGSLSDGTENKDDKPHKYIQTQVFDSAFGSRPDGPLNANQHWVGRDDTTELFFRDWDHVTSCFSSEFVKTTIGPDGPLFADFETSVVLMAYEKAIPVQTTAAEERAKAGNADLDVGNATVAMYFISTPDDVRDGSKREQAVTPLLLKSLETYCQADIGGVVCNVGAVSDKFDLNAYFGGADMPQYALVYKLFLTGAESVTTLRRAQREFEGAVTQHGLIDLHKSFILFSREALIMDMGKGIRFSLDRQVSFKDLPGPSHLDSESNKDFRDSLRTTLNPIKLDSSLKDFAFNWRDHIPTRSKQLTLDTFGFTGAKPLVQPWVPTSSAPEIPLDWLCENPDFVWEFARRCHLYSHTPIPALLHTCAESRIMLINMGYKLAFRTRSSGPRIWFNFDRDTLYLQAEPPEDDDASRSLKGSSLWDIGQFDPGEMRQVRKLALWGAANYLTLFNCDPHSFGGHAQELSSVLRLFSGLDELLFVDWSKGDFTRTVDKEKLEGAHRRRHPYDIRGLWLCVDVAKIDGLFRLFSAEPPCFGNLRSTGLNSFLLSEHNVMRHQKTYFEEAEDKIRSALIDEMTRLISTETTDVIIPWKIPRPRTVHVLPLLEHFILWKERIEVEEDVFNLQMEWNSMVRSRTEKQMSSSEWQEAERAFGEAHWPEDEDWGNERAIYGDILTTRIQKQWWIQYRTTPDPGDPLSWV